MQKENFYILLELSPAENDTSRINAAIHKKQVEWSKLRNHPTKGRKAQHYLGLIAEIETVMADPARRIAEAKAAQALLDKVEKDKFEKLDEYIKMLSSKGEVFEKELRKLSLEFSDLSEAEIRRRIKVPIVKNAPGSKKQLDKTTAKVISDALEIVGNASLYDFLGLASSASFYSLQKATRKKDLEIKKVALKEAVITASGTLIGQCQTVFKTLAMRDAYDATLAIERLSELDKAIEMMGVNGHIHFQAYQRLVKKAVGVGLSEDEARRYILEYCKKNNCLVDVAPVKPARQAKINKPPSQPVPQWVWGGVGLLAIVFLVLVAWLVSPSKDISAVKDLAQLEERLVPVNGKVFRDSLKDGSLGPEMVWIAAGSFKMGDSDEKPVHKVSVRRFAMGRYEVTFAEYDKFAEATGREKPSDSGRGRGNRPVINVSWHDATAYAGWLSGQTGQKYRLPTEAEWEYAARAGTSTKYWWGNDIGKNRAACNGCGAEWGWDAKHMTAPVGSFAANSFGLYDTVGNVWEWTCSKYESKYNGEEKTCNKNGSLRVLRGGAWINNQWIVQVSFRHKISADSRVFTAGFRLSRLITLSVNQNEKVVAQAPVEQAIAPKSGKEIYDSLCIACHAQGILNAPKFGDKAGWADRIAKGEATLIQNAINGFNVMPPRGGNASLSDEEVKLTVQYMLEAVGGAAPFLPQDAEKVSSLENGKMRYQQKCRACHTIGGGRLVGPDLKGVTSRRELSWLVRWIQEPHKMLAEGDPIATQLLKEYNNIPMPSMGVSKSEARDILAYIEAESFGN